jgi:RNA polymerase sigma factor (sigma-70 family)
VKKRRIPDARHAGFERMANEYGAAMLRLAAAQLGGRQLAEDAVQEALIKLYVHKEKFIGTDFECRYVMRTVLNACRDIQRSAWHKKVTFSAERAAIRQPQAEEARSTLLESIGRLEPRLREALLVRHYLGYSTRETASMLGVSEGVVRERLRRAKSRLPALIKESGYYDSY